MIPYGLKVATYQKQVHFDPVALLSGGDGGVYVVELTVAASLDCDLPVDGGALVAPRERRGFKTASRAHDHLTSAIKLFCFGGF